MSTAGAAARETVQCSTVSDELLPLEKIPGGFPDVLPRAVGHEGRHRLFVDHPAHLVEKPAQSREFLEGVEYRLDFLTAWMDKKMS